MTINKQFSFETSYNQFYILTDQIDNVELDRNIWDDTSYDQKFFFRKSIIGVGTSSYGKINGILTLHNKQPQRKNLTKVEYSYTVVQQVIVDKITLHDCPHSSIVETIKVPKGVYSIRVGHRDIIPPSDEDVNDFYYIDIWPTDEPPNTVKVNGVLEQ